MTGGAFAYNFVELTRNLTTSAEGYKILARDRLVVDSLQRFRVDFQLRLVVRNLLVFVSLICEMPIVDGREL